MNADIEKARHKKNVSMIMKNIIIYSCIIFILFSVMALDPEFIPSRNSEIYFWYFVQFYMMFLPVLVVFIYIQYKGKRLKLREKINYESETLSDADSLVQKYFPGYDEKTLLKKLYDNYCVIQKSYSNQDYNTLQEMTTRPFIKTLKQKRESLHKKGQKPIMEDFLLDFYNINNITEENDVYMIEMFLSFKCTEYMIDDMKKSNLEEGEIIHHQCTLEFIKNKNLKNCPNCGSSITKNVCEYCNTPVENGSSEFLLNGETPVSKQQS